MPDVGVKLAYPIFGGCAKVAQRPVDFLAILAASVVASIKKPIQTRDPNWLSRDEARRIAAKIAKLFRGCFAGCMDPGART
jgi:hypothetical protein